MTHNPTISVAEPLASVLAPGADDILAQARTQADVDGAPVVAVVPVQWDVSNPLGWLESRPEGTRIFWRDPSGRAIAGAGAVSSLRAETSEDIAAIIDEAQEFARDRIVADDPTGFPEIGFCGGTAFDTDRPQSDIWADAGFSAGLFVLPEARLAANQHEVRATVALRVEPGAQLSDLKRRVEELATRYAPPSETVDVESAQPSVALHSFDRAIWEDSVRSALDVMSLGELRKVVLARRSAVSSDTPLTATGVVRALADADSDCFAFLFEFNGRGAFVGATPERLFALMGRRLHCDCMAGTTIRGVDADEDACLAATLLASAKDRREHAIVVEALLHAMQPICERVDTSPAPRVARLATLQHLVSPVVGTLRRQVRIGQVLNRLHPTPAVGGWPRTAALDLIRKLERESRGWYAGPVGWIGADSAEFAVAIRSAFLGGNSAWAYAGAGIVAGSQPDLEWQETEHKLQAFVTALNRRTHPVT